MFAARGQLRRNPDLSLDDLNASLRIDASHGAVVLYLGVKMSFESDNDALTIRRLQASVDRLGDLPAGHRRELASIAFAVERTDLCLALIDGVESQTLDLGRFNYDDDDLRRTSQDVILHASIRSRLGLAHNPGKVPKSHLLALYQRRLESLGRTLGDSLAKRAKEGDFLTGAETFLEFLQRAEGEDHPDFERGRIDRVMDEAISTLVDTAALIGKDTLLHFSELLDARLATNPGRLGRSSVRRGYAKAMFRHDGSAPAAVKRIGYQPGNEKTPADHFREAALTAQSLAFLGMVGDAHKVLQEMHDDGVGYSRPAKKDPQYLLWEDFLVRANEEDPAGRSGRVRFFGRLLNGLANTEGDGAASRVVGTLLQEAARADSILAVSIADLTEECDLSTWSETSEALALGIVQEQPSFALVAAVVIGRLGIPFDREVNEELLSELIRRAPSSHLEAVVQKILETLEADAPAESRILAIECVVEVAAMRGVDCGTEALARWRSELPPPKSGNSPEDPFFLLRNLDEIAALLNDTRGKSNSYGAASAFQKVALHCDYEDAKSLFDREEVLNTDERVIDTMAHRAIAIGRRGDAEELLHLLERLAGERGSWGDGWRGKAKQRYFRLRRELDGEAVSSGAFDAFVDDLASRRESCDYILPELGSLFTLISPTITWKEAWNSLAAHLSQFREYKRGREIEMRQDIQLGAEHVLADILFRSVETTSIPLARMARTAAIEMAQHENGASVVAALLPRLWERGDYFALEAAQIGWECRSVEALKVSLVQLVPLMAGSDDLAIRRTAMMLAEEWNLPVSKKHRNLQAFYTITLPDDPAYGRFEAPSGMSLISSGLYADDLFSWTWMLENPMRIASVASGVALSNLRHRVGQLMSRIGGTNKFGPEAVKLQLAKLRRLSLHTSYRKLLNAAGFQALREVVGELVATDSIDLKAVPTILIRSGAYSPIVRTSPPATRPVGISAVGLPEVFASRNDHQWVEAVIDDLARPNVEGFSVVAATAVHERSFRAERWRSEQYFGPSTGAGNESLIGQIEGLPKLSITDRIELHSRRPSAGAIVHPEPIMAGSIAMNTLMLCPIVAAKLGWLSDPSDVFMFRNAQGEVIAYTLSWRDGGVASRETDTAIHRHGYAVLVRMDLLFHLMPYLAKDYEARAWRLFQRSADDDGVGRSAHRHETAPIPPSGT